jgi:hypothetical protein
MAFDHNFNLPTVFQSGKSREIVGVCFEYFNSRYARYTYSGFLWVVQKNDRGRFCDSVLGFCKREFLP